MVAVDARGGCGARGPTAGSRAGTARRGGGTSGVPPPSADQLCAASMDSFAAATTASAVKPYSRKSVAASAEAP
jgi:hypothetical protein